MAAKKKIKIESGTEETDTDKKDLKATDAVEEKAEAVDPIKGLQEKLESAEEDAKQAYDRFLRVSAEFENYKKRSTREMDEFRKFANQTLIKDLLPVVDNLELALKSSNGSESANRQVLDGVDLTLKEILKIFESYHVKPIECLGKPFDPAFHEAVMREETDDHPENTITNELQKGYLIHDRLVRPSMVVVATPKKREGEHESKTQKNE
jgi:molecular chaperone GrpE